MTGMHPMYDGTDNVSVSVPVSGSENVMVPVIRAVVRSEHDGDLVLLQRRSNRTEAVYGLLEIPGGRWRAGEPPADAVMREVFEESGVMIVSVSGVQIEAIDDRRSIATVTPLCVICGVHDAFPAIHTVVLATGSGDPRGEAGESHDVRWWSTDEVRHELRERPEGFVPSSRAALIAYLAVNDPVRG